MAAEHFIAHGECLLSAVRAVFNLALGAENPINKRTASNALLQMLNTICKRVTQIQPRLTGGSSECSSRTVSEALEMYYSGAGAGFHNHSPHSNRGSGTGLDHMASPLAPAPGTSNLQHQTSDAAGTPPYDPDAAAGGGLPISTGASNGARVSSSSTASTAAAARAAQLAELAEKKDLQGLEAALEAAAGDDPDDGEDEETAEMRSSATAAVVSAGLQSLTAAAGAPAPGGIPESAAAGAQGTGTVSGQLQHHSSIGPPANVLQSQASWQQPQPYQQSRLSGQASHGSRPSRHGQRLTTQEKDVLLVLTAFCKLASREVPGGITSSDSVLAQGKLLALEMLAKVRFTHQFAAVFWGATCSLVLLTKLTDLFFLAPSHMAWLAVLHSCQLACLSESQTRMLQQQLTVLLFARAAPLWWCPCPLFCSRYLRCCQTPCTTGTTSLRRSAGSCASRCAWPCCATAPPRTLQHTDLR